MSAAPYPVAFYVAHRVYEFPSGNVWGQITDGPCSTREELIETMTENFTKYGVPDANDVKAWFISEHTKPIEVTLRALVSVAERMAVQS